MIDVHPPHAATHTWRDFFIHIATIVVGLLIAVGLEQTVEYFHHRHQAHSLERGLDEESQKNRAVLQSDIAIMEKVIATEERNKAAFEAARASHGRTPFLYAEYDPSTQWTPPTNAAWEIARDTGVLSELPIVRSSFLFRLDFSVTTMIEISHQVFDARYRVLSLVHLYPSVAQLSAAEGDALLLAISNYKEAAEHLLMTLHKTEKVDLSR